MMSLDKAIESTPQYFSMLALMGSLSNLFSDSEIPYIDYRVTENLFCKYLGATNLARTDTAYDAKWQNIGIGIKTFVLNTNLTKQKIAEFNALSPVLKNLDGMELALKLADFRNDRIGVGNALYGIEVALYHIIARKKDSLFVFNTPYELINKEGIRVTKNTDVSLHFTDGLNNYSFNRSKSVLMKDFELSENPHHIPVDIIDDPFSLLESLLSAPKISGSNLLQPTVSLPLFSIKNGIKEVPIKSGLNQWNASGRVRDENEVYFPIPRSVHRQHPDFFPDRNTIFNITLPDGNKLQAKVCQQGDKALMSNPNKALGEWILRKVLKIKPGTLVTYDDLLVAGFDTLELTKNGPIEYSLNVVKHI